MNMDEIKACCKCTGPVLNNAVMPKPYNGLEGEDFDTWFRRYDIYYCLLGYSNELKCKIFPLYMIQRAEVFYHDLECSITGDYHSLVSAFKTQFSGKPSFFIEAELLARRQGPEESIHSYSTAIHALCAKLAINSKDRLFNFIRGLKPSFQRFVLSKQVSDVYEAEEKAKLYECIQLHCGSDSLPFSISDERTRDLTETNSGSCNKKAASWITQDHKQCFTCGNIGHIRRYCPKRVQNVFRHGTFIT